MPAFDAHIHAFHGDLAEQASLDRITRIKQDWRAYLNGIEEMKLHHNALGPKISVLLAKWEAEDRARRSSQASPAVCHDCGAWELEHFYTATAGGATTSSAPRIR